MSQEKLYYCIRCKLIYRCNETSSESKTTSKQCPNCGSTYLAVQATRRFSSIVHAAILMLIAGAIARFAIHLSYLVTTFISLSAFGLSFWVVSGLQGPPDIKEDLEFAGHKMGAIGARLARTYAWDQAIKFYERALVLLEDTDRKDLKRWTLERLGTAYMAIRHYQKTEEYYRQALDIAKELEDKKVQAQIQHNLGLLERKRKDNADA